MASMRPGAFVRATSSRAVPLSSGQRELTGIVVLQTPTAVAAASGS
jgi:hypothetical protein